jgi:hypothetical protein
LNLVKIAPGALLQGTVGYSGSVAASLYQEYRTAAFNYLAIGTSASFTWEVSWDRSQFASQRIKGKSAHQPTKGESAQGVQGRHPKE